MKEKNYEVEIRDCVNCVHYKHLRDDVFSCEKWECEYERRENNDGTDA